MPVPGSSRPRVFVSSTIYDFRDLRSALKFWLEELGYDVQMSDHADFDKPLDANSYDACLKAIDSCDYFVLLIGARVGGLYSKPEKVSITRMEYRRAYERFKESKLTLVPFVRRDVWDVREDRTALREYLRSDFRKVKELGDADVDAISMHESKFATDAEAVFSFIDEVTRAEDMRVAVRSGMGYPKGNWIHVFDGFADVASPLQIALGSSSNLRRRTLEASLKHEILRNLQGLIGGKPNQLYADEVNALRVKNEVPSLADLPGTTRMDAASVNCLAIGLSLIGPERLETMFLEEAIRSGEFLTYDKSSDAFQVGPEQACLLALRGAMSRFRSLCTDDVRKQFQGTYGRTGDGAAVVAVKNVDLLSVVMIYDAYENVTRSLVAGHRMLNGNLVPIAPRALPAQLAGLPMKRAPVSSLQEVEDWVKHSQDFV